MHMYCLHTSHHRWGHSCTVRVRSRALPADCCTTQWAVLRCLWGYKGQKSSPSSGHWLIDWLTGRLYVCFCAGACVCVCLCAHTIGHTGVDCWVSSLSFHPSFTPLPPHPLSFPLVRSSWHLDRLKCCVLHSLVGHTGEPRGRHCESIQENSVSGTHITHPCSHRNTFLHTHKINPHNCKIYVMCYRHKKKFTKI